MLLRLQIHSFKNLRDIDVRFGPLTCFIGRNGVGKSNLFDAIQFLRLLSEEEIQHASEAVRSPSAGGYGPADLFPEAAPGEPMRFVADMIVPDTVVDDFGEEAIPSTNLLRYSVAFRLSEGTRARLEIVEEELLPLKKGDARRILGFPHRTEFRESALKSSQRKGPFISTTGAPGHPDQVRLHQDGGSRGRPVNPGRSPRTVLGGTNTKEYPTVLAARREMSSWHSLHLEPSSLRAPDPFGAEGHVTEHGAHLAAALRRLSNGAHEGRALAEAANRLSELVPEIQAVRVDEDASRQQLTVQAKVRGIDRWLGPRALSDGTLRFLALVTMQMDPEGSRVLCMEEPENGIHPESVPAVIRLLRDYAVDPELPIEADNVARQVVLNSHSTDVLKQLQISEILFVDSLRDGGGGAAVVASVEGGWRRTESRVTVARLSEVLGGAPIDADLGRQLQLPLSFAVHER